MAREVIDNLGDDRVDARLRDTLRGGLREAAGVPC